MVGELEADWQRRVVGRSLRTAAERSVDRGLSLINAAVSVIQRSNGADITVQEVADEAGQSLRTLYQYFESKDDLLLAVFEEAMRTYASMIERATKELTDPLDRLAGAMLAAVRMPEFSDTALERGMARLRLKLSEVAPDRVAQAQSAVADLVREAVEAAAEAGRVVVADASAATFVLVSMNSTYITAEALGNDVGARRPDRHSLILFCLRGLGADVDEAWVADVEDRLVLPKGKGRGLGPGPRAKRAPRKSKDSGPSAS
ncbi:MAG TPA: TetR/AcrR family transcriptional regulator [Acidimicrobiales bacterium]